MGGDARITACACDRQDGEHRAGAVAVGEAGWRCHKAAGNWRTDEVRGECAGVYKQPREGRLPGLAISCGAIRGAAVVASSGDREHLRAGEGSECPKRCEKCEGDASGPSGDCRRARDRAHDADDRAAGEKRVRHKMRSVLSAIEAMFEQVTSNFPGGYQIVVASFCDCVVKRFSSEFTV